MYNKLDYTGQGCQLTIPKYGLSIPLCYAVPPSYAVFYVFFFHPKNRVLGGDYCTTSPALLVTEFGHVTRILLYYWLDSGHVIQIL